MSDLTNTLATIVGNALHVPTEAQADTYAGPPSRPCVRVRATSAPVTDPTSGETQQAFVIAAYGVALDLDGIVQPGDRVSVDNGQIDGMGSVHRLSRGTILESTLPSGTTVQHAGVTVSGHAWSFSPESGEGERSARWSAAGTAAHLVASELDARLAVYTGRAFMQVASTNVDDIAANPDGSVSVTLSVHPASGADLAGVDVAGALAAATHAVQGRAIAFLGRLAPVEIVSQAASFDGRRTLVKAVVRIATI